MPAHLVQTSCALRGRSPVCGEQDQPAPDRARLGYGRAVPRETQQARGRATLRRGAIEAAPYPPIGPQTPTPCKNQLPHRKVVSSCFAVLKTTIDGLSMSTYNQCGTAHTEVPQARQSPPRIHSAGYCTRGSAAGQTVTIACHEPVSERGEPASRRDANKVREQFPAAGWGRKKRADRKVSAEGVAGGIHDPYLRCHVLIGQSVFAVRIPLKRNSAELVREMSEQPVHRRCTKPTIAVKNKNGQRG